MARRGYDDGLAYGDLPQRWDRDRFQRFGGQPPPRQYEEDYRYTERDRPGRRDVQVTDRIDQRGPGGNYEERDRYSEHDRFTPGGRRKRTDRELFGDQDPREIANMALTPYRKSVTREDMEYEQRSPPPRPGLLRRQSSLDTFDRRPIPRYEREEYRVPVYAPAPMPYRPPPPGDGYGPPQEYYPPDRGRQFDPPEEYREVEIQRSRSIHRTGGPKSVKSSNSHKSHKSKSRRSSSSSSSSSDTTTKQSHHGGGGMSFHESQSYHGGGASIHESFDERRTSHGGESIHESFHEHIHGGGSVSDSIQDTTKRFKKGKTRMPKRLVRREAIMDLGYPFDEEEAFFVLRIALEKEQIDEVIRISETYKSGEKKTTYKYDENVNININEAEVPRETEEVQRTEWINPPTVIFEQSRNAGLSPQTTRRSRSRSQHHHHHHSHHSSHGRSSSSSSSSSDTTKKSATTRRSRSQAPVYPPPPMPPPPGQYYEERRTVIEERDTTKLSPGSHYSRPRSSSHGGALVVREREYKSDRDINSEIARLEAERRALRLEREADIRREKAQRIREEDYQLVEYREPRREVLEVVERERSPQRNVVRVEKDRKGRMALVRSAN